MLLILPFPPSGNHRLLRSKQGFFQSERYRAYIKECWCRAKGSMPDDTPLKLTAVFFSKDKRRYDLDNAFKCLSDTLQAIRLVKDDYFFFDVKLIRGEIDKANPRVEVEIEVLQ